MAQDQVDSTPPDISKSEEQTELVDSQPERRLMNIDACRADNFRCLERQAEAPA
jgi:hypothetical protein